MKNILYLFVLFILGSCARNCDVPGAGYMFEIPATLSPKQRVYSVGDTISLRSVFSDNVYERATEQDYLLENFLFYPGVNFERLDTAGIDTIELVTEAHFDFLIETRFDLNIFNSIFDGVVLLGQYIYANNEYILEYEFVAKKPGMYLMYFSSDLGLQGENQDFPGKCDSQGIANTRTVLNDGADNNADLLLEAVDPGWHLLHNNRLDRGFHDLGGYCFKVE